MIDRSAPPPLSLILGGVRSGKSRLAQSWIEDHFPAATYLATSDREKSAADPQMRERLERHRRERSKRWTTIEEPLDLAGALGQCNHPPRPILVECLTLWLANLLEAERDPSQAWNDVENILKRMPRPVVLVSSETGLGTVPSHPMTRRFRDEAGILHQNAARLCHRVVFVIAGVAQTLKNSPP